MYSSIVREIGNTKLSNKIRHIFWVICLAPSTEAAAMDRMSFIRNPGFRDHYLGTYLDGYKSHFSRTSIGTGIDLPRLIIGVVKDTVGMVTNCQKIHGQNNNRSIRRITQDEKNPDRREYLLKPGVLNRLHEVARILVTNRRDRIAQNRL